MRARGGNREIFAGQNFPVERTQSANDGSISRKHALFAMARGLLRTRQQRKGCRVQVTTISYYGPVAPSTKSGASKDPSSTSGAASGQTSPALSAGDSVEQQFLNYAHMNPIDRMRANILKSMGLTEDSLKNMSPEQRKAVEDKIRELIEQEFQKNTDKKGQLIDVSA
jgi:hypothetical protein